MLKEFRVKNFVLKIIRTTSIFDIFPTLNHMFTDRKLTIKIKSYIS